MTSHDVANGTQQARWKDIASYWQRVADTAGDDETGRLVAVDARARAEFYERLASAAFVVVGR